MVVNASAQIAGPRSPLALVGMTASGKTAVSLELASKIHDVFDRRVELVSADSLQVYREMNIGTAKPNSVELASVPHHLIDVIDPIDDFDVSTFQSMAAAALDDIEARGAVGVLVGGTGLYHQSVIDGLAIPPQFPAIRAELEAIPDTLALHARLQALDPEAAAKMEPTNRRRIVRALEVCLGSGRRFSSYGPGLASHRPSRFVQIGLRHDREVIRQRIGARLDDQFAAGFVDEVIGLRSRWGTLSRTAMQALGYREIVDFLDGNTTLEECRSITETRTAQFAVRQERWFRRDPRIHWIDALGAPDQLAEEVLRVWLQHDAVGAEK